MLLAALGWTGAACTQPSVDYLAPDVPPVTQLDAAGASASVASALAALVALDADSTWTTWQRLAADADPGCPAFSASTPATGVSVRGWQADCDGASVDFSGEGFEVRWVGAPSDDYLVDGWSVELTGEVVDADGDGLIGRGVVSSVVAHHPEFPFWRREFTGDLARSTTGMRAELTWSAGRADPVDGRWVSLDGALVGLEGAVDALGFDDFVLLDRVLAGDCAGEPAGTLSIREAETALWWDLVFDGRRNAEDSVDLGLCDGCGAAFVQGVARGEVCVDASVLLDWEAAPW